MNDEAKAITSQRSRGLECHTEEGEMSPGGSGELEQLKAGARADV